MNKDVNTHLVIQQKILGRGKMNNSKFRLILLALLTCSFSVWTEAKVKFPAIFSDGMVLQREQPVKIWGKADAGENVEITFKKKKYSTKADENGKWQVVLPSIKAGGPYEMNVNDLSIKDILIGDVWLCSGQSNMELTAARVTDMFRSEIESYSNPMIRYVKIPYGNDLHGPKDDISRMDWKALTIENAPSFSALAYFFAKEMYNETKVPVGIVNSSWGGSSVEAWMSEDALQAFPKKLRERDIFNSDEYRALANKCNGMMSDLWNTTLYKNDKGLHAPVCWYKPELDDTDWKTVDLFSSDWAINSGNLLNGAHWFRQHVSLTKEQASKNVVLRLGCIRDADSVFVNGTFVGTTAYQYPPRIYKIPASLLQVGDNTITVRLISYGGFPGFVKDKLYCMAIDGDTINLSNQWKYKLGCELPSKNGDVSFQNIPTGMYNSMISPLKNLSFKGALWYQGETNTGKPDEYEALLTAMINDWRTKLGNKDLPFFIVQLANFMQTHPQPVESGWAGLREAQRQVSLKVPNTALAVAIDLGEWNDIHPLNKKELARRISLLTKKVVYDHKDVVCNGPICKSMTVENGKLILSFEEGTNNLMPVDHLKGFAVAGEDGRFKWAQAVIENNKVIVWNNEILRPIKVRYAWDDNPQGVNLKNNAGLPASPFQMTLEK